MTDDNDQSISHSPLYLQGVHSKLLLLGGQWADCCDQISFNQVNQEVNRIKTINIIESLLDSFDIEKTIILWDLLRVQSTTEN